MGNILNKDDIDKIFQLAEDIGKTIPKHNDALNRIYLHKGEIVCSDSYRLGVYKSSIDTDITCSIPLDIIKALKAAKIKQIGIVGMAGADVELKTDKFRIQFKQNTLAYPKYDDLISIKPVVKAKIKTAEFLRKLEGAKTVSDKVVLKVYKDCLEISAESEIDNYHNNIEAKADGEIKICLNNKYLATYLKRVKNEYVEIDFISTHSQIYIHEENIYEYILVPCVMKD